MDDITVASFENLTRLHATWIADFEGGIDPPNGYQLQLNVATVRNVVLTESNYMNASLNSCRLEDCSFVSCIFASSELMQTTCVRCKFDGCSFVKADLRDFDASDCSFVGCNFTRADLTDARLISADCSGCVFDWAWLIRTDLRNAILNGIKMSHSRLDGTKLFNARKWDFGVIDQVVAPQIDFSENGDGSVLIDWPETINRLSKAKS